MWGLRTSEGREIPCVAVSPRITFPLRNKMGMLQITVESGDTSRRRLQVSLNCVSELMAFTNLTA